MLDKILCFVFGHQPTQLDTNEKTARCSRCGKKLSVSYDMAYGDTIVECVIEE